MANPNRAFANARRVWSLVNEEVKPKESEAQARAEEFRAAGFRARVNRFRSGRRDERNYSYVVRAYKS